VQVQGVRIAASDEAAEVATGSPFRIVGAKGRVIVLKEEHAFGVWLAGMNELA
jgi:hypothetical protein